MKLLILLTLMVSDGHTAEIADALPNVLPYHMLRKECNNSCQKKKYPDPTPMEHKSVVYMNL